MHSDPLPIPVTKVEIRLARSASLDLDLMRGIAAILVALSHYRYLFFKDYEGLGALPLWGKAFYFLTSLGHQSVMVFFVLSGYLVGGSVMRAVRDARFDWLRYGKDRLTRLYVVLVPALILGMLWDASGISLFGQQGVYGGIPEFKWLVKYPVVEHLTWSSFLGSATFLQTVVVPSFGSNGPLWSLANEFWYYVSFPLLWIALFGKVRPLLRIVAGSLGALVLWAVGPGIALLFPVWLFGALLAYRPLPNLLGFRVPRFAVFVLWMFVLCLHRSHHLGASTVADLVLGAATCLWISTIISGPDYPRSRFRASFSKSISEVSYSLYLLHMPLMLWLSSLIVGNQRWSLSPLTFAMFTLAVVPIAFYAWGGWWLFERNTLKLRALLSNDSGNSWMSTRRFLVKVEPSASDSKQNSLDTAEHR